MADETPLLAALYGASLAGRIATGPRAGQRGVRVGDRIDEDALARLEGEREPQERLEKLLAHPGRISGGFRLPPTVRLRSP